MEKQIPFTPRSHPASIRVHLWFFPLRSVEWAGAVGLKRPEASNQLAPAPHRTERTVFPYSALRTHSSGGFPACRCWQFVEAILLVKLRFGVMCPEAMLAGMFTPNPPSQAILAVCLHLTHYRCTVAVVEVPGPSAHHLVSFLDHGCDRFPARPVIEDFSQFLA